MMNKGHVTLRFESRLPVPQSLLWQWITSVEGIRAELWPLMRMTLPRGVRSLADLPATPGFRCSAAGSCWRACCPSTIPT